MAEERSKIKSVTIVNQQGTCTYIVGTEYNGLLLDNIRDDTVDAENIYVPMYRGFTKQRSIVFETVNAPVDVAFELDS